MLQKMKHALVQIANAHGVGQTELERTINALAIAKGTARDALEEVQLMEDAYPSKGCHGPAVYTFMDWSIGQHMMDGIKRYLCEFIPPGSFLTAIICNNLKEAVGRADGENIRNIPAFVSFFYNEAPLNSWGSIDDMNEYTKAIVKHKDAFRQECLSRMEAHRWLENELDRITPIGQDTMTLKDALAADWSIVMKYQYVADAVNGDWKW